VFYEQLRQQYDSVLWDLNLAGIPAVLENLGGSCYVLFIRRHGWIITVASTTTDGLEPDLTIPWDWDVTRYPVDDHSDTVSHMVIKRKAKLDGLIRYIRSEMDRMPKR
jgi:hypothetical protein